MIRQFRAPLINFSCTHHGSCYKVPHGNSLIYLFIIFVTCFEIENLVTATLKKILNSFKEKLSPLVKGQQKTF